jgi:hypothetical protein
MARVRVTAWQCERCDWRWMPRGWQTGQATYPVYCPACSSQYWDRPRQLPRYLNNGPNVRIHLRKAQQPA